MASPGNDSFLGGVEKKPNLPFHKPWKSLRRVLDGMRRIKQPEIPKDTIRGIEDERIRTSDRADQDVHACCLDGR
jgi:hypothetical protein